jgi:hypothetical protein
MSYINYPKHTPYAATQQTAWHISRYADRAIPAADDDALMSIDSKYQYRPDLLSYDLYGSVNYWWVFYRRNLNVIKDPIWDFTSGKEIIAPSLDNLRNHIG